MNHFKRRTLAILLALLCGLAAGCGRQAQSVDAGPSAPQLLAQTQKEVLDNWFSYLSAYERTYNSLSLALDGMEAYYADPCRENLLKAQAMTSAALMLQQGMELTPLRLTQEAVERLDAADISVNAIQRASEAMDEEFRYLANTARLFALTMQRDIFLRTVTEEQLPMLVAFYRQVFRLEGRLLCCDANYLLLELGAAEQWERWMEQLPFLSSCADPQYTAESDLDAAYNSALDAYEALIAQQGSQLGLSEYTLELVRDAVESGDTSALAREILPIRDVSAYFPQPDWLPETGWLYLVDAPGTGQKQQVNGEEPLSAVPTACSISCGAVAKEEIEAYQAELEALGVETCIEEEEGYRLLAGCAGSTMRIEWSPEETVLYLSDPVGCLIPPLYLQVMSLK